MNENDLEAAVAAAAASKSDRDYLHFFEKAKNVEFFFNYGEADGQMTVPLVSVGENKRAVVFYTSKDVASRFGKCAGIQWERGLEMVVNMPAADGLVVQNLQDYWVAIMREKIAELLTAKD